VGVAARVTIGDCPSVIAKVVLITSSFRIKGMRWFSKEMKWTANSAKRPFRRKSIVTNRKTAMLNVNGENDGHTHSVSAPFDILES
jgi:hypothetical protein